MRQPAYAYPLIRPPEPPYALRGAGAYFYLVDLAGAYLLAGKRVAVFVPVAGQRGFWDSVRDRARKIADLPTAGFTVAPTRPPLFGPYDFAATLGFQLAARYHPDAGLLNPALSTEGFDFTPEEFLELKERLLQTLRHYDRMPQVSGALNDLHTGHFRHGSMADARAFVVRHCEEYLRRARALHRRYLPALHGHARRRYFERRGALDDQSNELNDLLTTAEGFARAPKRKIPTDWLGRWQEYHRHHHGTEPPAPGSGEEALAHLAAERGALTANYAQLERDISEEQLSLSTATASDEAETALLAELEKNLRELLRDIDESGLYQLPLGNNEAHTTVRQSQQLQSVLTRLRHTHRHLHEFDAFYARRHFWYAQPAHLRRLMGPLLDLPTADWQGAFEYWYFESCLRRGADAALTTTTTPPAAAVDAPLDHLTIYQPGATYDLIVDYRPTLPPGASRPPGPVVHLSAIDDREAIPVARAGELNPGLVFTQAFHASRPPDWAAAPLAELRPTPEAPTPTTVSWRPAGSADPWLALDHLLTSDAPAIDLLLPHPFGERDREALLAHWTKIFAADTALRVYHAWPQNRITEALLSDGFNADFLAAAIIRGVEAASDPEYDPLALTAIGREVRTRLGLPAPAPSPLARELAPLLREHFPDHFVGVHVPWRDLHLPLVVTAPDGKKTVVLANGRLPGYDGVASQQLRRAELEKLGFAVVCPSVQDLWERGADAIAGLLS